MAYISSISTNSIALRGKLTVSLGTTQDCNFIALYNSTSRELLYANQFAISSITNVNARFVVDPELQTSSLILGIDANSVKLYGKSGNVMCDGDLYPSNTNMYDIGSADNKWKDIYLGGVLYNTSDRRLKTDIANISIGLEFIDQLRPVQYKLIEGKKEIYTNPHGSTIVSSIAGKRTHYGLIAQEVQSTMKSDESAVWMLDNAKDPESAQGLCYTEFIAPMIKSIQDLHSMLQSTNATLESHSAEIRLLKLQLNEANRKNLVIGRE
jgi:hypothetical protein